MSAPPLEELRQRYSEARFLGIDPITVDRIPTAEGRQLAAELSAAARMIDEADASARAAALPLVSRPRILTILHSCLPWLPGGYSGRAQGILEHLTGTGSAVLAVTRAGFLGDMQPGLSAQAHPNDLVGEVVYQHVDASRKRSRGELQYMESSIGVYTSVIERFGPSVVHLRSSYPSALPGLIAARRAGVPVVYEVSGLWELVHDGRGMADLAARARTLEAAVMRNADAVVTLTGAMRTLIEQDYAPGMRVALAPNAVDVNRFRPAPRNAASRRAVPVVGYVGTLVDYEGLELLVTAIGVLRSRDVHVRGLIVGGGPELPHLEALIRSLDLVDHVTLRGPVDAAEIPGVYEEIDIAPLPRFATPATEVVSPLKPFEAMAMALPLIVSDVSALAEIVEASGGGLVFRAGEAVELADKIEQVLDMTDRGAELGQRGRAFVERNHTWEAVGSSLYGELVAAGRRA